jgi:Flp pilus assembly protein TadD
MLAQLRLSGVHDSKYRAIRDSVLINLEQNIPEDMYVLEAKAGNAARTGTPDDVEKAWLKILDVNPNHAVSYNMLGYLELHRGNYDQAIEYMQKYAFLAPDLANPHDSLGEIYMVIGRYEDAQHEFKKSIEMQPDFYYSIINLGKVFLARGQLDKGLSILEKVRAEVKGSNLEQKVDQEIIGTYIAAGLDEDLGRTVADYVVRYPDSEMSPVYRAVSLAYQGRFFEGRAVMDSTLAEWRSGESYTIYPAAKANIDRTDEMFEAMAADVAHDHATSELHWAKANELFTNKVPLHDRWYFKYRYAAALHANGKARDALAVIDPILAVNNRLINLLVLKTRAHVVLGESDAAQATLKQLQKSLQASDRDFPARDAAEKLEIEVSKITMKD